ncbi:hypothetical protein [Arthrobacter sp. JSM 101049]|uniref:hypothetical protein n=1 Tax=Arthrobacter sp. JSM 101049 TaxID=929097 RepID=UPI0035696D2D
MYLEISNAHQATVHDMDNLRELQVRTHGATRDETDAALVAAGLGSVAADHAWLGVTALQAAGADRGDSWEQAFTDMIDHAGTQGWLSEDRLLVRAHLIED